MSKPEAAARAAQSKADYYAKNKHKWLEYHATQKTKEATVPASRAARLLGWIRARAGRTAKDFDLTREWIFDKLESGVCEATGIPLELSKPPGSRFHPWAPSVDRIDCKRGYTQDNCRVVCWIYNMAKSEWTDEVVLKFAEALTQRNKEIL